MNNILYIEKMPDAIAAKHLDTIFKKSSYLDIPPKITLFGTEPWSRVEYILSYFRENWIRIFENGKIILITKGLSISQVKSLSQYKDYIEVHAIVDKGMDQTLINSDLSVTARIIFSADDVNELYDKVCNLVAQGVKSFFLQRTKVDQDKEQTYHDAFRTQMDKIVKELLDGRRLRLDITEQFPTGMDDAEDFYFIYNEDLKFMMPDGTVNAYEQSNKRSKDAIVIPVVMTEACNFDCKYCYVSKRHGNDFATISSETIHKIPDFIEKCLLYYNDVRIDIFGGEPLVYWDKCKELIECLEPVYQKHQKNFSALIFTNGSLLTEEILRYTKTKPFVDYHFSLDGCKKSNDNTRQYKNGEETYDDIQDALSLYNKFYMRNKNNIATQYVISPDNISNFYDSMVYLHSDGYKKVDINYAKENVWTPEAIEIYREQYRKVADFIIDKLSNDEVFYIKQMFEPHAYKNIKKKPICSACNSMVGIGADGKIYPCQRFFNNRSGYSIGTLEGGIDHNCETYKMITNFPHSHMDKCKGCELEGMCGQHCLCAMYENGDMNEYIDSICEINKINYETAEYIHTKLRPVALYRNLSDKIFCTKCC